VKHKLFGDRPVGAVSLVEASLSRSYAHKARLAFFATAAVAGALAALVLSAGLAVPAAVLIGVLLGVVVGFVVAVVVRAWPVLRVLWWWVGEITAAGIVLTASVMLARLTAPLVAMLALLALAGVVAGVGPVRRWVWAFGWCGAVRHRLRLCFGQFIRSSARGQVGSLPLILLARPTPAGARVWVWLRPGLALTDLEGKTPQLAVACWAGEVRVVRASPRYAALLRVDLARRDPLTRLVSSPLVDLLGGWHPDAPVSPGMPPVGLDLDDVPEPAPEPRITGRR
jgi:hypothetical protein